MNIKKHIPNTLTLINLFSGCLLVFITLSNIFIEFHFLFIKTILILLGISLLADLLDGMVARLLNVASPIGLQLDSLADMVTFGVFPGFLMMKMIEGLTKSDNGIPIISFFGFLITLFSALRLAKFNVDVTQTSYFKGLPTPANTILIFGIYVLLPELPESFITQYGLALLIGITIVSSFLLVANIPLLSFKIKSFKLKKILPILILLISSIILLITIGLSSLPIIITIYILLSIIFKKSFTNA